MFKFLDYEKVSFHFNQPPSPNTAKGHGILKAITQIHSQLWHHAPVSISFCRVPGIGGEVALERFPAFVVVLIQTVRGLQPPLGDSHI